LVYRGSRVRSPPVPVVLSVYQRGSLLDGLAIYLSCNTKKFHDNESTHILHNFWTSTPIGGASHPSPLAAPVLVCLCKSSCACQLGINKVSSRGGETICLAVWIYVCPRKRPQSAHLWWTAVAKLQVAMCLQPRQLRHGTDRRTDERTDRGIA